MADEIKQKIASTQVEGDEHGNPMDYIVGRNCDRIEIVQQNGEYAHIPYVRVWNGDICLVEFNQHKATFVRFSPEKLPPADDNQPF